MDKILLEYLMEKGMSASIGVVVALAGIAGLVAYITKQVRSSISSLAEVRKILKSMNGEGYDYKPIVFHEIDVTEVLTNIRSTIAADRVLVLQYHNGEKSIASNPFLKLTCTHEILGPSSDSVQRSISAVPMSMFGEWNRIMFKGGTVRLNDFTSLKEEATLRSLYHFLGQHNATSMYVFPVQDAAGRTFGMGLVEHTSRPVDLTEEDLLWAAQRFQQVGALLVHGGPQ